MSPRASPILSATSRSPTHSAGPVAAGLRVAPAGRAVLRTDFPSKEGAVEAWQQRSAVCHRGALRDQDQSAHAEEIVPKGKADQEEEDTQRWF